MSEHKKFQISHLLLLAIVMGGVWKLSALNSEISLRFRFDRYYDSQVGTRWATSSSLNWLLPSATTDFFVSADTFEVTEFQTIKQMGPNANEFVTHHRQIKDLVERRRIMDSLSAGITGFQKQRIPIIYLPDYFVKVKKGKTMAQIDISFVGHRIKVPQLESAETLGEITSFNEGVFDGSQCLESFQKLARQGR